MNAERIKNQVELLEKLDELVKNREFKTALDFILEFEKNHDPIEVEVSRYKARALSALGERKKSLEILEQFIQDSTDLADWHLASELSIELGQLNDAKGYLSKTIEISLEMGNEYFLQTCYLERAYVKILLKEFKSAVSDLNKVDECENIFWLNGISSINKKGLLSKCDHG